ncbi:hypothetical protein [Xenorhabdus bovienii]|uniref:hypothetical protein n=1 Tax=Xenorhabdus bovienii TaxID=40576 RepID=UPI003DA62AE2
MSRNSDVESRTRKTRGLNSLMVPTMLTITVGNIAPAIECRQLLTFRAIVF